MASDRPVPYPTPEMWRRALITIGALGLYRLGCQIPLPGLDYDVLSNIEAAPGRGLARVSIFALGVMPIFSALLVVEIAKMAFPPLDRVAASEGGKPVRLCRVIQVAALALAALQGLGIAHALEGVGDFVDQTGLAFEVEIVAPFVAATAFLSWLGDRMTVHGLGAGFWILLVAAYVARLPNLAVTSLELARMGAASSSALPVAIGFVLLASALIVALAKARLPEEASSPFAGSGGPQVPATLIDVWPPLLAQYVPPLVIGALAVLLGVPISPSLLTFGEPLHILLTGAVIAGFGLLRASGPYCAAAMPRPSW